MKLFVNWNDSKPLITLHILWCLNYFFRHLSVYKNDRSLLSMSNPPSIKNIWYQHRISVWLVVKPGVARDISHLHFLQYRVLIFINITNIDTSIVSIRDPNHQYVLIQFAVTLGEGGENIYVIRLINAAAFYSLLFSPQWIYFPRDEV